MNREANVIVTYWVCKFSHEEEGFASFDEYAAPLIVKVVLFVFSSFLHHCCTA